MFVPVLSRKDVRLRADSFTPQGRVILQSMGMELASALAPVGSFVGVIL